MKPPAVALVAIIALLGACAGASHGGAQGPGAAAAGQTPPPPRDIAPAELLARAADEADVVLHLSVARAHPLGAKLEPFVLAWPGWGSTIRRFTSHPLADLDWIDVVGPRDPAKERLAARTTLDDPLMDSRLAASGDGSLRVSLRPEAHLVTAVPPDGAAALTAALRGAHVIDPKADADEGVRALLPQPHSFFKQIPEDAQSALLRVLSRPDGAALAEIELTCADPAHTEKVASSIREQVDHANNFLVRMVTKDLLSGLTVRTDATTVKVSLPASRAQLEALAALAAAFVPPQSGAAP
jgi:hypothetical protein